MAWTLTRLRLAAGRWEGRLTGPAGAEPPPLAAVWPEGEIAAGVAPEGEGRWRVTFDLPAAVMSEGARTLAIGPRGGEPLCRETLSFGEAADGDLRAELAALRTEVEVLKRALRRHLAGGA